MSAVPFSALFGAFVYGVCFQKHVSPAAADQLRALLRQYGVLIFRNLKPLNQQHVIASAAVFGHPVPSSPYMSSPLSVYRVFNRSRVPVASDFWHSDRSYTQCGAGPTLLYGVQVAPVGVGDTLFADASLAAAELPDTLRQRVRGLHAEHNGRWRQGLKNTAAQSAKEGIVLHPVLRTNPFTGREAIFVSPAYTRSIQELSGAGSVEMLSALFEHMLQPRFLHRHQWQEGDLLVWDNGRVLHRAATLDMPKDAERILWRVSTESFGVANSANS